MPRVMSCALLQDPSNVLKREGPRQMTVGLFGHLQAMNRPGVKTLFVIVCCDKWGDDPVSYLALTSPHIRKATANVNVAISSILTKRRETIYFLTDGIWVAVLLLLFHFTINKIFILLLFHFTINEIFIAMYTDEIPVKC